MLFFICLAILRAKYPLFLELDPIVDIPVSPSYRNNQVLIIYISTQIMIKPNTKCLNYQSRNHQYYPIKSYFFK